MYGQSFILNGGNLWSPLLLCVVYDIGYIFRVDAVHVWIIVHINPRIGEFLKNYGLKVLRVKWIEIGRVFVKPGCSFSKDWGNKTWSVHQHVINKTDVLLHALGPDFYLLHVKRWISYFENLLNGSEWNHRVHMLCYKFKTCLLNFIFFCDQKWLKASFLC